MKYLLAGLLLGSVGMTACASASPRFQSATVAPAFAGWLRVTPKTVNLSVRLPSTTIEETLGSEGNPIQRYAGEAEGVRFSLIFFSLPRAGSGGESEREEARKQALERLRKEVFNDLPIRAAYPWTSNGYGGIELHLGNGRDIALVKSVFTGAHMIAIATESNQKNGSAHGENNEFFSSMTLSSSYKKRYPTGDPYLDVRPGENAWSTVYMPIERLSFQLPAAQNKQILQRISYNRHGKTVTALRNDENPSLAPGTMCQVTVLRNREASLKELEDIVEEEATGVPVMARQAREIEGFKAVEISQRKSETISVLRVVQGPSHLVRIEATEGPRRPPGATVQRCLDSLRFEVTPPPKKP